MKIMLPYHVKWVVVVYADSEGPDQAADMCSLNLIMAISVGLQSYWLL